MSNHIFSQVPRADIQRSSFDRSHSWKGTLNEAVLVPILVDEVLPGDTFNVNVSMLCRLATPIVPFMDSVYLDTFFFFVPNRLVWTNFVKMMGEQEDPDDSIDYLVPQIFTANTEVEAESVLDYMGFPIGNIYGSHVNNDKLNAMSLPLRGYELIWNEFMRDENLQDSIKIQKGDTAGYTTDTTSLPNGLFHKAGSCLPHGKRHDYFTSCLPWPVKYGVQVDIPLGTSAPVYAGQAANALTAAQLDALGADRVVMARRAATDNKWYDLPIAGKGYNTIGIDNGSKYISAPASTSSTLGYNQYLTPANLIADLSSATAATINSLRQAFQIQRLLEADARGGTRYQELILSHFSVRGGDARLQRPEYLGGTSTPFIVSPVPQTNSTDDVTPQGNLAAYGVLSHSGHGFVKSFVEHGWIIGLACIRADLNYQQGLNRMWSRKTRYDYYWPTLAHLGEQAVLNKEIYAQGTSSDEDVFGYQERFAEYRYFPNQITGKFRSTYSQPLDSWHLAQKFDSLPTLSDSFIRDNPPISRVVAVPSEPHFLLDCYFRMSCVRPLPLYGVPGLIDHY